MASVFRAITDRFHGRSNEQQSVALRHSVSSTSLSIGRRYSVTGRSAQITQAEQAIHEEYCDSMTQTIRINERQLVRLEDKAEQLAKENITLRAEVIELAVALEGKWLQQGDRVAAAIGDLFQKFQALHQNLSDRFSKANEIEIVAKKGYNKNPPGYDYSFIKALGPTYNFLWGQSTQTLWWYHRYNDQFPEQKFLGGFSQLHQTLSKDAFQKMIKEKIYSVRDEILSPKNLPQQSVQPPNAPPTTLQSAESSTTAPHQLTHAADRSFYKTLQQQATAQKTLKLSNLQLEKENTRLEEGKKDLKNMESRFVDHFSDLRSECLAHFHFSTTNILQWHEWNMQQYYPNLQQEAARQLGLGPYFFDGGTYTTQLELTNLVPPLLKEMDLLVDQIKQGCPSSQSTT